MPIRMRVALLGMLGFGGVGALSGGMTEFGQVALGARTALNLAIPLTAAQVAAGPKISLHYGIDFSSRASGCQVTVTFAPAMASRKLVWLD